METFQKLILTLFSLIFLAVFLRRRRSAASCTHRKRLPPSPRSLPIIGNLHQLGLYPHRSLQSLSKRYGHLMLLHFGNVPVLVASSAEAAREIMKNQDLVFCNRPKLSIPDRVVYSSRDIAFSPYGEYWRQVRSVCVVHLLSPKMVQSFRRVREEETSIMIEKIRRLGSSSSSVVNLSDVLVSLTNDVVCRAALGRKYGGDGEGKKFQKFLRGLVELLGTFSVGDYVPWLAWINGIRGFDEKVENVAKMLDEFVQGVLEDHRERRRREKGGGDDFVDILLDFQRDNEGTTSPIEDEAIKAVIIDVFGAGTDTTFSVLEWAMAELIRSPKAMKTLQAEVREVAGSKDEINEEDLDKLPYLKAVIKETLRLHSPVPLLVPRESTRDTKVLGYDVAANTRVLVNAWAIGRDPSLWKDPEQFYPERFLGSSVDFRGLHFELIPFGAGRRGCPGTAFAVAVDELALAKLVHKFDFALMPDGGKQEDLDMTESYGMTVHKKLPLLVVTT